MRQGICQYAECAHARDDSKSEQVFGRILRWKQVCPVNLRKIAQSVDHRKCYCSHFLRERAERAGRVAQRDGVRRPQSGCHDD